MYGIIRPEFRVELHKRGRWETDQHGNIRDEKQGRWLVDLYTQVFSQEARLVNSRGDVLYPAAGLADNR